MFVYILKVTSVLVILFTLICFVDFLYTRSLETSDSRTDLKYLILGDSHTQAAINDSLIPGSYNSSLNSENYFYCYYKLIYYNKVYKITNLILGVSNHSFSSIYDDYNGMNENSSMMYKQHLPILDYEGKLILLESNYIMFFQAIPDVFRYEIHYIFRRNYAEANPWDGGYYPSKNSNLNDTAINKIIKRHFFDNQGNVLNISSNQVFYLSKIIDFCKNNNINLFLVITPLHKNYSRLIPLKFCNAESFIPQTYKNLFVLDFSTSEFNDKLYGDGDHLNYYGAKEFSTKLLDTLNSFEKTLN